MCKIITQNPTITSLLSPPQLNDVEIKESVDGDEKSWGLWHEHRGSVRRYTLQGRSSLLKLSWLKDLKELQQRSSLPTNSQWEINNSVNNKSANFLVEFLIIELFFSPMLLFEQHRLCLCHCCLTGRQK